jgi:uncharacterized protein (TIGR00288 family)
MQKYTTAPHRGGPGLTGAQPTSPNAALLIDFDNVTMGIRSDLTRQLKELLNSDIIKGKVAVQRAYADWRRYAQYIVPLSEASVDLIFAPAYGSSKKNATDIRLAIDALELVFTRPEIGTFILLSGDSDFSSLVLKLKEYGKYVVGVGLRESASDLLVQNCDEYFSYSSLTGLTRAGEEDTVATVDAWELAERAVNQMASDRDVMRSDRLKQVMLELDPTFDEGQLGFTKFNRFLTEAASRNRIGLKKLENGQYEVQPYDPEGAEPPSDRDRGRGRGRRDRGDESRGREPRQRRPSDTDEATQAQPAQPAPQAQEARQAPQARPEPREQPRAPRQAPKPEPTQPAQPTPRARRAEGIDHGYELVRRAISELTEGSNTAARDSDIKRKMLELESGWDEAELGFTKFSRFLRQAHDAEVIDLTKNPDGFYEARVGRARGAAPAPERDRKPRDRDRGRDKQVTAPATHEADTAGPADRQAETQRRRERPATQATDPAPEARAEKAADRPVDRPVDKTPDKPAAEVEDRPAARAEEQPAAKAGERPEAEDRPAAEDKPAAKAEEMPAEKPAAEAAGEKAADKPAGAAAAARPVGFGRRGRRGGASDGPPPLLPGQAVGSRAGSAAQAAEAAPADMPAGATDGATDTAEAPPAEPAPKPRKKAAKSAAKPRESAVTSSPDSSTEAAATSPEAGPTESKPREAPGASLIDSDALGLPTDRGAVIRYLSNSYQGVGQKTAEALIDAFGEDRVFQGLNDEPDRVREILGMGRRTEALINAWQRDYRRRTTAGQAGGPGSDEATPAG